jgi:hypothetical protein
MHMVYFAAAGFPREHNWVLHGPENDRTLGMRNWLAYGMLRQMGRYASRTRYFELFLNTVSRVLNSCQTAHTGIIDAL